MKKKVLVVGGAGYIGSHMAKRLSTAGHSVSILDNLSTGFKHLAKHGELFIGDIGDKACLKKLFSRYKFDAVMHFAACSLVGESSTNPEKYYINNVSNTLVLLDVMREFEVSHFIFSSTAAVFGEPTYTPIDEKHTTQPINPYGASKLMVERVLEDYAQAYGLNSVALRYFNACGADSDGELGECHDPETHLIPLVLQAASGRRKSISIFGEDYETRDGTCVRDYVHVEDLCSAHELALQKILHEEGTAQALRYNLGNGEGFTVKEVIETAEQVVAEDGKTILVEHAPRRMGDPAVLVADSKKAELELGWKNKTHQVERNY